MLSFFVSASSVKSRLRAPAISSIQLSRVWKKRPYEKLKNYPNVSTGTWDFGGNLLFWKRFDRNSCLIQSAFHSSPISALICSLCLKLSCIIQRNFTWKSFLNEAGCTCTPIGASAWREQMPETMRFSVWSPRRTSCCCCPFIVFLQASFGWWLLLGFSGRIQGSVLTLFPSSTKGWTFAHIYVPKHSVSVEC